MDWEAIGAVGEILGAGAVFLSLGYLAIQVKVASTTTKQSSQNAYVSDYHNVLITLAQDSELTELLRRGMNEGLEALDGNAQMRFHYMAFSECMRCSNMYRQLQANQFDTGIGEPLIAYFAMICKTKGGAEWWHSLKNGFDQDFAQHIDSLVKSPNLVSLETIQPWLTRK